MAKQQQFRDPLELKRALEGKAAGFRRFLGVDLGTNCGVCLGDVDTRRPERPGNPIAGQLDLSVGPWDTGPLRHIRLKQFLSVIAPDVIGFEDVKFTPDVKGFGGKRMGMIVARVATASELLGAFKVTLTTWAEEHGIPAQGIPIGTIKKFATGKGNAGKPDMIAAANAKFGVELDPDGYEQTGVDNIADAMHIWDMMITGYKDGF